MPFISIEEATMCAQQADDMAVAGADMLAMMPHYGVYNEVGMIEMRKAICAYLGINITDEQASDARGWDAFIEPHIRDTRNEVYGRRS